MCLRCRERLGGFAAGYLAFCRKKITKTEQEVLDRLERKNDANAPKSASKWTSFVRIQFESELSVKLFDRSNIWTVGTNEGRKDIAAMLVAFFYFLRRQKFYSRTCLIEVAGLCFK